MKSRPFLALFVALFASYLGWAVSAAAQETGAQAKAAPKAKQNGKIGRAHV